METELPTKPPCIFKKVDDKVKKKKRGRGSVNFCSAVF